MDSHVSTLPLNIYMPDAVTYATVSMGMVAGYGFQSHVVCLSVCLCLKRKELKLSTLVDWRYISWQALGMH